MGRSQGIAGSKSGSRTEELLSGKMQVEGDSQP